MTAVVLECRCFEMAIFSIQESWAFSCFSNTSGQGGKILAGWRQEELEVKTAGTGSVSSAVCDNHIGRLEAGCKLVLYPAVKEQLWWRCIYMQMKRTTQRQSRGEVRLEIILNPGWWRREVSRLKEDLKRMRGRLLNCLHLMACKNITSDWNTAVIFLSKVWVCFSETL